MHRSFGDYGSVLNSFYLKESNVPLLPIYVEELNGNKSLTQQGFNVSGTNETQRHSFGLSSIVTGGLVSLAQWTEVVANFLVGPLADKIGYDIPLFIGYFIVVVSSTGFAFANSYATLALWRAIEGVGAAFVSTAGIAIVADMYRDDDKERGKMVGLVMCGYSIGLIVGPPYGSLLNLLGNKSVPFATIAALTVMLALLQLCVRIPRIKRRQTRESTSALGSQLRLIRDPYVLMCALLIMLGFGGIACLEGALPLYMLTKLGAESWMTGTIFVPINVLFAVSLPFWGWLSTRTGRWPIAFGSFIIGAVSLIGYGYARSFEAILLLGVPVGMQMAIVVSVIYPIMAYLVDTRIGDTIYGSAYALANVAGGSSFAIGPLLAGILMSVIGFKGIMFIMTGLTLAGLIPAGLLRKPLLPSVSGPESARLLPEEQKAN